MENGKTNTNPIRSFQDLEVYKNLYKAMLIVHKEVIPNLPPEEKNGRIITKIHNPNPISISYFPLLFSTC